MTEKFLTRTIRMFEGRVYFWLHEGEVHLIQIVLDAIPAFLTGSASRLKRLHVLVMHTYLLPLRIDTHVQVIVRRIVMSFLEKFFSVIVLDSTSWWGSLDTSGTIRG